jgi:hypothetical protein
MRYQAKGAYIIDTTTDIAVARSIELKGVNLLADAEAAAHAKNFAEIIAAALNVYNEQQGGI